MSSSKQRQNTTLKWGFLWPFWWNFGGPGNADNTTWSECPVMVLDHFVKSFSFYLVLKKRDFYMHSQLCIFHRRCVSYILENWVFKWGQNVLNFALRNNALLTWKAVWLFGAAAELWNVSSSRAAFIKLVCTHTVWLRWPWKQCTGP